MKLETFPEFFVSHRIFDIVKEELKKNMNEKDLKQVIKELISMEPKPESFLKELGMVLKRHVYASKASKIIMRIKDRMRDLVEFKIKPEKIKVSKNGEQVMKVYVENKTETMLKIKVGVKQVDRKYTALLHDPVKNFGYTKLIKSKIVNAEEVGAFKFIIKPDVYGIQDLYELKKKNEINMIFGVQIEADGICGMKSSVKKIPVKIVKVKI